MPVKIFSRLILPLLLVAVVACAAPSPTQEGSEGSLRVVATTDIVADVVRQVAGDTQPVTLLVPRGSDIHSFQPSPRDVATIAEADVLFTNGLGLERFLQPVLDQAGGDTRVVDLSAGLEPRSGDHAEEGEDDHEAYDPHVWLNPTNVMRWTEVIASTLGDFDPANAAQYDDNAAAYREELAELDRWISTEVETIPPERRLLVIDHETLGYFAEHYGFEQLGTLVEGVSSMAEPSAQTLGQLQRQIEAHDVPAIFVNSSVNPAAAETLARDLGVEIVPIYAESLSPPDGPAPTYLESMRYNTRAIVQALR